MPTIVERIGGKDGEGRAEGRAEGRLEERRQNAKKMKDLSVPVETISQVTGLSVDEIDSL